MKIQLYSDLHVDVNRIDTPEQIFTSRETPDIYLDAGDTGVYPSVVDFYKNKFWKDKRVCFVAGNHMCYDVSLCIEKTEQKLMKQFSENNNVTFLQNYTLPLTENLYLIGCTLWTDFKVFGKNNQIYSMMECRRSLNDYRYIRYLEDDYLTPKTARLLCKLSFRYIKDTIKRYKNKTFIILTHHTPSIKSAAEKYKNDPITAAFCNNFESFIDKNSNQILFWFHGHVHNTCAYQLNKTIIACNPLGYVNYGEGSNFKNNLVIDV